MKMLFGSVLAILVIAFTLFLSPPVAYTQTPGTAPFWYGTVDAYKPPPPLGGFYYNPFLFDDGVAGPPTMACTGAAPSLSANLNYLNIPWMPGFDNNPDKQGGLIFNNSQKSWDGYTLLSCQNGCAHPEQRDTVFRALLVANDGALRARMAEYPKDFLQGYGQAVTLRVVVMEDLPNSTLVKQDWCGNEVWHWDISDFGIMTVNDPIETPHIQFHHDYQLQGNPVGYYAPPLGARNTFIPKTDGKVLALAEHYPEEAYYYPTGWVPEGHPARDTSNISKFPLVDDCNLHH